MFSYRKWPLKSGSSLCRTGLEFPGIAVCLPRAGEALRRQRVDNYQSGSSLCRTGLSLRRETFARPVFSRFHRELMTNAQFSISNVQVGKTAEKLSSRTPAPMPRETKKSPKNATQPLLPVFPLYLHTSIPPYLHTSIPPYLHTSIPPYLHTSIP